MDLFVSTCIFLVATTFCIQNQLTLGAKIPLLPIRVMPPQPLMSNSINPTPERLSPYKGPAEWVKISQAPLKVVNRQSGAHFELECEAIGSPSPRIQWLKDNQPITDDYDYGNNLIVSSGIAKVKSRLVISGALPQHTGVITCWAEAGSSTAMASSTVFISGPGNRNFSDYLNAVELIRERVRIILFNTFIMENIGSTLIIPCKVIGKPKPEVIWFDNEEQVVNNNQPGARIKVLPDGELSIENLIWSDMGTYTCLARNSFSKDTVSTFVYPMLNEN